MELTTVWMLVFMSMPHPVFFWTDMDIERSLSVHATQESCEAYLQIHQMGNPKYTFECQEKLLYSAWGLENETG